MVTKMQKLRKEHKRLVQNQLTELSLRAFAQESGQLDVVEKAHEKTPRALKTKKKSWNKEHWRTSAQRKGPKKPKPKKVRAEEE